MVGKLLEEVGVFLPGEGGVAACCGEPGGADESEKRRETSN